MKTDQEIYIEWFNEAHRNGVDVTPEIAFMAALRIMTARDEQGEAELFKDVVMFDYPDELV